MKFIFSIILERILTSLIIYSVCVSSRNIFLRSEEEELSPTCSLPCFTMADRVAVLRGNDMTPVKEISINNRRKDNCYYGNQITEYSISESNITLPEEGDYTCVFYLNDTVSHKHEVLVRKAPKISTTFLEFNEKYTDICCKVVNTMYQNKVKVFFVTGGVTIEGKYVGKKEDDSNDSSRTTYYLRTDPSHINTTSEILCKVEYFGAVISLAVNLSEIPTRVTPINQSNLLTNEEEEDPYVAYDKKKFDNYTFPGKRVDIDCFFDTCGNESISSIVWSDTNYPYNPLIGTVKSKDNVEIDFHKEDDYSIVGYDGMLRSTLVIPKAHINNGQCYEAVATMGKFTQKCRYCLLVADQAFFKWYTTRNNETILVCYAASYVTPIILWKVNGVTFTGKKTDASVFVEGDICRKCGASYIVIRDNRDKHTVKKPSCINWTGQRYSREYPIDYEKYPKNKINKLESYRVLTNLIDLE
ncbi:CRPV-393 [Crowpox virus]|nr:CRPV-393 [Crowpox virus]